MTVAASFFNWQRSGLNYRSEPWTRCAPNLEALLDYLRTRWGGYSLGCHLDRSIIAGGTPSSHAYGAALDWRYGGALDRDVLIDEVLPFLIDHSAELGIDAIHDYVGDRIWRAARTGNQGDAHTAWWKDQNGAGGQMGKSWAVWLHVETHHDTWSDRRPISDRLTPTSQRPVDLLDISSWQTITKWAQVPNVPIVHRVITKENDVDRRFPTRMPFISKRTDIFGGYVVVVGGIATAQMGRYIDEMRPFWRNGAFTQIDIERWSGLPIVTIDELDEIVAMHEAAFGPGRLVAYINPTTLPELWAEWIARHPDIPRWIPGYGPSGPGKAIRYGATLHQWTSEQRVEGFTGPVDANEVIDWATLRRTAGLDIPPQESSRMPPYVKRYRNVAGKGICTVHPFSLLVLADDDLAAGGPLHGIQVIESSWEDDIQRAAIEHVNGPIVAAFLRERAAS